MPYSSSLTDEEWEILEPLLLDILPKKKRTRPCDWSQREIVDGILYQLKNGCNSVVGGSCLVPVPLGRLFRRTTATSFIERPIRVTVHGVAIHSLVGLHPIRYP